MCAYGTLNGQKTRCGDQTTSDLLLRCQITSKITNGPLYTPDASASYGVQWTRDFAYMSSRPWRRRGVGHDTRMNHEKVKEEL